MSFFKKVMASVGVGATKIDAVLDTDRVCAGDSLSGVLHMYGGNIDQEVESVTLKFLTEMRVENDSDREDAPEKVTRRLELARYKISDKITVTSEEHIEIPFHLDVPVDMPVSLGEVRSWVRTEADVSFALDPKDDDAIEVMPHPVQGAFMNALDDLGFRIREIEFERKPRNWAGNIPFIQEFEFFPVSGQFRGKIDELEVAFVPCHEHIRIYMELDRRTGWLGEMLGMDESNLYLDIPMDADMSDASEVRSIISDFLSSKL
ncbi:sporulation-control protein [Fulvitalea axinellae]|uniref:Sporulation-control protein n=1 Tax=Fulvitalea axinellae TaxID=1182444 RepID=A0AAU9DGR8_9BACT|nr:sporulation-control protein [Fulvitalea axinellae]